MFTHVVMFKSPDRAAAEAAQGVLLSMRETISVLREIEVGVDEGGGPRSWSLCLITRFDSAEDYSVYATHPEHAKVKQALNDLTTEAAVVDWAG